MGTKRLLNIAVMLCAAVLLAILVLPGSLGPGMRMSAVLVLAILAILYVMLSRADASSARDLAVQLAGARTEKEEIETRARSIIDGMSDPTVVIDNEHRVSVVNKAAIDALGLDESHTVPCFRALHGLDAPCDAPGHPCVLNTGQSNKTIQTRQDSNGGTRLVEQRTTPLFDDAGNVIGAIEEQLRRNYSEEITPKVAEQLRADAEATFLFYLNAKAPDLAIFIKNDTNFILNGVRQRMNEQEIAASFRGISPTLAQDSDFLSPLAL